MPYLHVNTTQDLSAEKTEQLRNAIADCMPLIPGKTRENTMIHISGGCALTMGDSGEDCVFLEAHLYGPAPREAKEAFTRQVCAKLTELLGVKGSRIYMNLLELDHWGSNGVYKQL